MAEIRQIQVDGVNYDLVISEDEVSATAAAQSAAQALAYKNQAQTSAAQAQTQATNASNQADRAEDAASRAEQIVGGEFVSYGGDQGLTTAQQSQARANIMAGGTNPNLLDNSWWGSGEVVNQRGVTAQPSSNGAYCIDRWVWTTGATANTMSLGTTGLTFTISSSSVWFQQKVLNYTALSGKTLTASVMYSDGTIKSGTANFTAGTQSIFYSDSALRTYLSGDGAFTVTIMATKTIRAVKLELGSVSTLANDAPPDYGEELRKCQRYFLRLKKATYLNIAPGALAENSTNAYGLCYFPVPMRAIPTLTVSGSIVAFNGDNAQNIPVTILSVNSPATQHENPHWVSLRAQTASGLTQGNRYDIQIRNDFNGYVDFSADL